VTGSKYCSASHSGVGSEGAGSESAPKKFFICRKNLGKISENPSKNDAQRCLSSKNGAQRLQKNK